MIKRIIATVLLLTVILVLTSPSWSVHSAAPEANYLVNSDQDAPDANLGDGVCATSFGNCTLRAAVQEANRDGMVSKIKFAYAHDANL